MVLGCRQSNKNDLFEIIFVANVMNTGQSHIYLSAEFCRQLPYSGMWHMCTIIFIALKNLLSPTRKPQGISGKSYFSHPLHDQSNDNSNHHRFIAVAPQS